VGAESTSGSDDSSKTDDDSNNTSTDNGDNDGTSTEDNSSSPAADDDNESSRGKVSDEDDNADVASAAVEDTNTNNATANNATAVPNVEPAAVVAASPGATGVEPTTAVTTSPPVEHAAAHSVCNSNAVASLVDDDVDMDQPVLSSTPPVSDHLEVNHVSSPVRNLPLVLLIEAFLPNVQPKPLGQTQPMYVKVMAMLPSPLIMVIYFYYCRLYCI